jgi:hypothetical protein
MVRKTIIITFIVTLLQFCSQTQKANQFYREKEILNIIAELGINNNDETLLLVVRTKRCDLCTDAARELFNQTKMNIVALIDADDSGFHSSSQNSNKLIVIKSDDFFESRGIDFGQNYLFLIKNNDIQNYSIVSNETKEHVKSIIQSIN